MKTFTHNISKAFIFDIIRCGNRNVVGTIPCMYLDTHCVQRYKNIDSTCAGQRLVLEGSDVSICPCIVGGWTGVKKDYLYPRTLDMVYRKGAKEHLEFLETE